MRDDTTNGDDATRPVRVSRKASEVTYEVDGDERPSRAVVRAVASLTDRSVLDLDPLYHVVDPDCLDGLTAETRASSDPAERSVSFRFNGCTVTVAGSEIRVQERDGDD